MAEKIDVLELLIDCLREHEKELDHLAARLEKAVEKLETPEWTRDLIRRFYEPI